MSPHSFQPRLNLSAGPSAANKRWASAICRPSRKLQDLYPSATSTPSSRTWKSWQGIDRFRGKWKGKLAEAATKNGDEGIGGTQGI